MRKNYLGLFFISVAALALEVSLIRLFSIAQWYHFAFMIVSIALFGIAASGTFLSIKRLKNPLAYSSLLFSLSTILAFFITNNIMFDPFHALVSSKEVLKLFLYYLVWGLPFFFFGIIVAYLFSKFPKESGKTYFFNLSGSAIGSLGVLPLIALFGSKVVVAVAIIGLLSFFCFSKKKIWPVVTIILFCSLFFFNFDINISKYKELNQALNYPNAKLLSTDWNSFSRVDVVNSSFTRYAPGLSSAFRTRLPPQLGVTVDAGSMNAITKNEDTSFIGFLPSAIGYELFENPKVLIINSGAGLDVLSALYYNSSVTAVESNPIVINLLKEEYKYFSGDIYGKEAVFKGEGRSFVKKNKDHDIIVLSLAGNVLSSSAGVSSLSENYLLTVEAFKDYYNSLSEDGVLIVTRWLLYPPRESLKLFSIASEINGFEDNTVMFRSWTTVTLLLSKKELTKERISKIKGFIKRNKFDTIYLPSDFTPNVHARFEEPYYYNSIQEILKDKESFYKDYLFGVKPAYDDKPFYFNFFKFSKFPELYNAIGKKWQPFFDSGFLLMIIFFQAVILSALFILLPIRVFRNIKIKKKGLIYFFCIGISFLFIEIVFIQKAILFLGQPVYATSTVIFATLLFSSIGSYISRNFESKKLKTIIKSLFLLIIIYYLFLSEILNYFIVFDLPLKIIILCLILAPLSFFMGMPFPLGIRTINKKIIPWAWAVNGSASVISTIAATIIALSTGYSFVLLAAGSIYALGYLSVKNI